MNGLNIYVEKDIKIFFVICHMKLEKSEMDVHLRESEIFFYCNSNLLKKWNASA